MKRKIDAWEKELMNEDEFPKKEGFVFAMNYEAECHPVIVAKGCQMAEYRLDKIVEELGYPYDEDAVWVPENPNYLYELEDCWYEWGCPKDLEDICIKMEGIY